MIQGLRVSVQGMRDQSSPLGIHRDKLLDILKVIIE